jgi:hypothetical protein
MLYAVVLALVLLWAIVADVLIIALIFWYGRRTMELSARLKNLKVLLEQERADRLALRKRIEQLGAGLHELLDLLEAHFAPEPGETATTSKPKRGA